MLQDTSLCDAQTPVSTNVMLCHQSCSSVFGFKEGNKRTIDASASQVG